MPQMINRKLPRYAGKELKPGERFTVAEEHVRKLTVPGFADLAPTKDISASEPNGYATREMASDAGRKRFTRKSETA